jgi:DUF4097 and DUF4098 domain-containing protein YvlB
MRYFLLVPLALAALTGGSLSQAAEDKVFDRTVAAQPQGVVDVSNVSGEIDVVGWDRDEVSVHAELESGVDHVEVSSEGGRTVVKVVLPSTSSHDHEARVHVKIPKNSELDVSAVSADVSSSGVLGVQRLTTVSGDVNAELAGADAELKTVSGDVKLKGHGQPARLHVTTVSGDVHIDHGAGELEASTVSGTLVTKLDSARGVRVHTTSGDLHFEGKLTRGATFEATTVSGDLNVRGGADGGYAYEVSSFSGDISDCFGAKAEHANDHRPGSSLEGTRGDGAGHVRLKTMSGDIELCDRS